MPHSNIIKGKSEEDIWKQVSEQLNGDLGTLDYTALLTDDQHEVMLDIDIDPGGGFESGDALTSFTARLPEDMTFRFSINKQGFRDEIGKLFGLQDVIIGDEEFDKKFMVKSNDIQKVKEIFADSQVRSSMVTIPDFTFEIREHKIGAHREVVLAMDIDGGITDPEQLIEYYRPFKIILDICS